MDDDLTGNLGYLDLPEEKQIKPPPVWEEVADLHKKAFPLLDQDKLKQSYEQSRQMNMARQVSSLTGTTTGEYFGKRSVPLISTGVRATEQIQRNKAQQRIAANKPERGDYQIMADQEQEQKEDEAAGFGGQLLGAAAHLPSIAGEFALAGGVTKGLGTLAPRALARWAPEAAAEAGVQVPKFFSMAGASQAAGWTAATTALVPSMTVERMIADNREKGREPTDPRGFLPAYGLGLMQTAILGSIGKQAARIPGLQGPGIAPAVGRYATAGGTGVVETYAADVLGKAAGLQSNYGSFQDIIDGKKGDALKNATVTALTFMAFNGMHELQHGTPFQVKQAEGYQEWLQKNASQGMSADYAGQTMNEAAERLQRAMDKNPDFRKTMARQTVDDMPKGPVKEAAKVLADLIPEHLPAAGPHPGLEESPPPAPPKSAREQATDLEAQHLEAQRQVLDLRKTEQQEEANKGMGLKNDFKESRARRQIAEKKLKQIQADWEEQRTQAAAEEAPPVAATPGGEAPLPPGAPPEPPAAPPAPAPAPAAVPEAARPPAAPQGQPGAIEPKVQKAFTDAFPGAHLMPRGDMRAVVTDSGGQIHQIYVAHDPTTNMARIDFNKDKPGVSEKMLPGSKAFLKGLGKLVDGLKEAGVGVEYTAVDTVANRPAGGKHTRAEIYARQLEKAGYEQTGGPGVDKGNMYQWKPKVEAPVEPAAERPSRTKMMDALRQAGVSGLGKMSGDEMLAAYQKLKPPAAPPMPAAESKPTLTDLDKATAAGQPVTWEQIFDAADLTPHERHIFLQSHPEGGARSVRDILKDKELTGMTKEGEQPSHTTVWNRIKSAVKKMGLPDSYMEELKKREKAAAKDELTAEGKRLYEPVTDPQTTANVFSEKQAREDAIENKLDALVAQREKETQDASGKLSPKRSKWYDRELLKLYDAFEGKAPEAESEPEGGAGEAAPATGKPGGKAPVRSAAGAGVQEGNQAAGPAPAVEGAGPPAPTHGEPTAAPGGREAAGDKLTPKEIADAQQAAKDVKAPPIASAHLEEAESEGRAEGETGAAAQVAAESRAAAGRAAAESAARAELSRGPSVGGFLRGEAGGQPLEWLAEQYGNVKEKLDKLWDDTKKVFAPAARGPEARSAAGTMRENLADMAKAKAQAIRALKAAEAHFDKMIVPEKDGSMSQAGVGHFLKLTDAMESGSVNTLPPELQGFAQTMRDLIDGREKQVVTRQIIKDTIEDYMGHLWKRRGSTMTPEEIGRMLSGRRPLAGKEGFTKERWWPTYREGIESGLEPIDWNPARLVLKSLEQVDRSIMAHDVRADMEDRGLRQFVRNGQQAPDGWVRGNDRKDTVYGPSGGIGPQLTGHYYYPEQVSRLLDNYTQPGLVGNAVYDSVRGFGNLLNQMQLGFSLFHLGFVSMDAQVSSAALATQHLGKGQLGEAAKQLPGAVIPLYAPIARYLEGSKVLKEYFSPGSQGAETAAMVNNLIEGGGRGQMDAFYKNNHIDAFLKSYRQLKNGQVVPGIGGMLWRALPALAEVVSKPVLEHVVPRMKMGVFADMARYELQKLGPNSTSEQRQEALGKAWDSVENRLGQLTYDNLFWNRTFKDVLMAGVRSVGWNLGTARELGGGLADVPASAKGVFTGQGITPRTAYLIALPMVTAIYGALYQYLSTGKGPDEAKDLWFPKTGEKNPDGTNKRVALPSYMRDVAHVTNRADEGPYRVARNMADMAKGKLNPAFGTTAEMLTNEDFYGKAIVNPNDPIMKQNQDLAIHLLKQFESFSLRNAMERGATGRQIAESVIGITPAPKRIERTSEEQRRLELHRKVTMTPLGKKLKAEK